MRAIVQREYGGSEMFGVREVEVPECGANEVLVRVRAAGVDRGTWHLMTGEPFAVRLGFGLRRPKVEVPGRDLAGVVEAVGTDVTKVSVGDEVFGTAEGSFAEFAVVPESRIAHKPVELTFEQAAVLPISGATALQALRDRAKVRPGDRVLVIGASGGVGSYAVQIAVALGAEVTGVASGAKADFVRGLGASEVIDYTQEGIADRGTVYDVIIDTGGNRPLRELRRVLADDGTLVIIGGETDGWLLGGADRQLRAMVWSPFAGGQRLTTMYSREKAEDFEVLAAMAARGEIAAMVDRVYPLEQAPEALDLLASGKARGKIAIAVA